MKILIVYGTKYGCTKKCVENLKTLLNGDTTILSAKNIKVNVDKFDTVIIGGSVYMGKIQKEVSQFCKKNKRKLLQKKLALFVCCYTPKETEGFFESLYYKELISHAYFITSLGGEMNYEKMNFLYRKMFQTLKKIDGFNEGFIEPQINMEEITKLAKITNEITMSQGG